MPSTAQNKDTAKRLNAMDRYITQAFAKLYTAKSYQVNNKTVVRVFDSDGKEVDGAIIMLWHMDGNSISSAPIAVDAGLVIYAHDTFNLIVRIPKGGGIFSCPIVRTSFRFTVLGIEEM